MTVVSISKTPTSVGGIASDRLQSFIERLERIEEEKKAISDDMRDVFAEAKAEGFDPKIMRKVMRIRKMKVEDRNEEEELLDLYKQALGML